MRQYFGTDGLRGVANEEPMTPLTAFKLGRAAGYVFRQHGTNTVLVGRDTRVSGDMLESALIAGLCSVGTNVCRVGVIPTPAIAHLTRVLSAQAGIVVSASHNPMQDNGIKFFNQDGTKLDDALEEDMDRVLSQDAARDLNPTGKGVGRVIERLNAVERYLKFIEQQVALGLDLSGTSIVVDCAHGSASYVAPRFLEHLGAEVTAINAVPDGFNINDGCGSEHPQPMQEAAVRHLADIGLAFDGDGDRMILADERGQLLNGDHVLAICARHLHEQARLRSPTIVATVMSNFGLEVALRDLGLALARCPVGDRYVWEKMQEVGAYLGGEQCGHVIFREHGTTGDGLVTALEVLRVMLETGKPLSELAQIVQAVPQVLLNIQVREQKELDSIPSVAAATKQAEEAMGSQGRVLVRYSGTQPLARVMLEGTDQGLVNEHAERIAEAIRAALG